MRRGEAGGVTAELVILTPLLLMTMLLMVYLGRVATSRGDTDGAAHAGARAASLARSATEATNLGRNEATAFLGGRGVTCRRLGVGVDTSAFRPGGWVAVDVRCDVDLSDLAGLHVPGSQTLAARFVSPIDAFRESR